MTVQQKKKHILALIDELPLMERIRIAVMVLRGIEPEHIPQEDEDKAMPWETAEFYADLDRRTEELRSGKVKGIPGEDFLAELRAMRKS